MKVGDWIIFSELWINQGEMWATEQDPMIAKIVDKRECGCCWGYQPIAGGRFWEDRETNVNDFIYSEGVDTGEVYESDDDLPAWAWGKIAERDLRDGQV